MANAYVAAVIVYLNAVWLWWRSSYVSIIQIQLAYGYILRCCHRDSGRFVGRQAMTVVLQAAQRILMII